MDVFDYSMSLFSLDGLALSSLQHSPEVAIDACILAALFFSDEVGWVKYGVIVIFFTLGQTFTIFNPHLQDRQFSLMFHFFETLSTCLRPLLDCDYVRVIDHIRFDYFWSWLCLLNGWLVDTES